MEHRKFHYNKWDHRKNSRGWSHDRSARTHHRPCLGLLRWRRVHEAGEAMTPFQLISTALFALAIIGAIAAVVLFRMSEREE